MLFRSALALGFLGPKAGDAAPDPAEELGASLLEPAPERHVVL